MWPFRRHSQTDIPTFAVDNTIGAGTTLRGDVRGPGGFRVEGTVEGSVHADGPVIIGEGGTVDGTVHGRDVIVLGRVRGDVRATGHLEIGPKGKIVGDVTVESVRMHKGGVFRGTSRMPGADDLLTSTNPFGVLPPGAERAGGRTLPPPAGAVPPPASIGELGAPISEPVVSEERLLSSVDALSDRSEAASG
jgi:cytoskeletal protein CcmA (bactofilin family)